MLEYIRNIVWEATSAFPQVRARSWMVEEILKNFVNNLSTYLWVFIT